MRKRSARGATLVEILLSLALVVIGMMAMFRVLVSSIAGSASASKVAQAQARAQTILEAIRSAPAAALTCLAATTADAWASCESTCRAALGAAASPQACVYTVDAFAAIPGPDIAGGIGGAPATHDPNGQRKDRALQGYALGFLGDRSARDSFVQRVGTNGRTFDVQVTMGWNDDGTAGLAHTLTLRSGVFQ